MFRCGWIEPVHTKCIVKILTFDSNDTYEDVDQHESDIMAEFYFDMRGILKLNNEFDYMCLKTINNELEARRYLTDKNYNLIL
jgi:hypothetical protein